MNVETRVLTEGRSFTICELLKNGKSALRDFIEGLQRRDRERIAKYIERIAENGPLKNKEKFNHEGDQIYAIKDGKIRIYCFFHRERLILLTNGAVKKTRKADPEELEKARKLRREFLEDRS